MLPALSDSGALYSKRVQAFIAVYVVVAVDELRLGYTCAPRPLELCKLLSKAPNMAGAGFARVVGFRRREARRDHFVLVGKILAWAK